MKNSRAIAAYWVGTFRGELDATELAVFDRVLEGVEVEDAMAAIDDLAAVGGYPPTAQRIAELSEPHRKERKQQEIEMEKRPQLQGANQPMSFQYWLENVATTKERYFVAKASGQLRKKFGLSLDEVE
jgi:hypothetical protein